MDGYVSADVAHNIPFLVVSGLRTLSQDSAKTNGPGTRIASELPPLNTEDALALLGHFEERNGVGLAWNGREHNGRDKFKIKVIARVVKPTQWTILASH